jgi:hypothetical protein
MDLKATMEAISAKFNYPYKDYGNGYHSLDVTLKINDTTNRYQIVFAKVENNKERVPTRILVQSRCGFYNPTVNLYSIIKEGNYLNYSTLCIIPEKDKDGRPVETLYVQSAPLIAHTTPDLLEKIVYEVGNNADIIEEKYFGGDNL